VQRWVANERALGLARQIQALLPPETLPLDRFSVVVPTIGAADPLRLDLTPRAVVMTARCLISAMVESLPLRGEDAPNGSIAERLWPRLTEVRPTKLVLGVLNAALVLLADHGVRPPATATVRLAASLRSDPYAVVSAAMGVGSGAQQARPFLSIQSIFDRIADESSALAVLAERLREGVDMPGFHPRQYGSVDPRARLLLSLLAERAPDSARLRGILKLVEVIRERRGAEPSVEVGVAALASLNQMCPGAGEGIFRVARTAGWIANALQAYAQAPRTDLPSLLNS
jgi:citrate synthase